MATFTGANCGPKRLSWTPTARLQRSRTVRALAAEGTQQPAGPTYQLTLRKPLGLVLAERKTAEGPEVFVEEVVAGGNAAKDGRVQAGDVLTGCSAVLLKAGKEGENEREGYGQRPYDNWEQVMFDARNKQFDTVMAALGSNSERWGIFTVQLEFERRDSSSGEGGAA
ncbi:PDZ domain [Chlorella sorokiniana]|uniref:PDZ domain n=1 Tax=Chlorella sorokiniana TaxID=3076 RepID=A0A2P6U4Z7_CHLSO|nr:PDZ domain [Chlorella sorokiniana]|eukprot:PRW61377.1 PDZ domain [Chlorella sorokiniana]